MGQKPRRPSQPQLSTATSKSLKRKRDVENVDTLSTRVDDLEISPGAPLSDFSELPLSQLTLSGLESSHFKKLTQIQANSIPAALKGRDVLGAAKTGSGKTLSFLVPVLENLYRKRWTEFDGLGALVLSPTRELAIQIFDVLRKIGRNHVFSAGLVIGGKSLQEEKERLGRMNILVATPGRMLQHMDQNSDLDIGNLQMLVLDEADRIMDMGFAHALDAIIQHLPVERQTLLYSATQTKKVSELVRLSLKDPFFVSVHETANTATPETLTQTYCVTPLSQKLDTLYSFIRANTKKKILVFLSSGKQVRFVYEALRHLQPGISLLHLHGSQKQTARLDITQKFSRAQHACLFATDVAARGLDFPSVDWVVQVDCPESADTYIHRVGRTARFEAKGNSVLFLDPVEEAGMLAALERKKVTGVEKISVRQGKMKQTIANQLQDMCFRDPELKYLGQKAFMNYVRSVYVMSDKDVFKLKELDLEGFAASLGLPGTPKVKFLKGDNVHERKNMPRALRSVLENDGSASEVDQDQSDEAQARKTKRNVVRTKYDRMFERRNQDVLADHYSKMIQDGESQTTENAKSGIGTNVDGTADADSDNDFLAVRRTFAAGDDALNAEAKMSSSSEEDSGEDSIVPNADLSAVGIKPAAKTSIAKHIHLSNNPDEPALVIDSKRREKLLKSKKALLKYKGHGSHLTFDSDNEDGKEKVYYEGEDKFRTEGDAELQRNEFLDQEKERKAETDVLDKEFARQKRRERKAKRKQREREEKLTQAQESADDDEGVQLVPYDNDHDMDEEQPMRRNKKWFEEKGRRRDLDELAEPQTLEDLEALAQGLLAR